MSGQAFRRLDPGAAEQHPRADLQYLATGEGVAEAVHREVPHPAHGVGIGLDPGLEIHVAGQDDLARIGLHAAGGALDEGGQRNGADPDGVDALQGHDAAERAPAIGQGHVAPGAVGAPRDQPRSQIGRRAEQDVAVADPPGDPGQRLGRQGGQAVVADRHRLVLAISQQA